MSTIYNCILAELRPSGIEAAVAAVRDGDLVVLPTDTVYGIGADAFTPAAVRAMLAAKGRGRNMPSPVLVGTARAAAALVDDMGAFGQDLIDEFWPGALTLVFRASPTLLWDLGDTKGTVALRMPLHSVTLEVLKQTGPMAVSSANRTGKPPAMTAQDAEEQLGEAVSVYLDAGPSGDNVPSTILDLTGAIPRVLREGAIPIDRLRSVASIIADESSVPSLSLPEPGAPEPGPQAEATDATAEVSEVSAEKPAMPHPLERGEPPSAGGAVS
ncbi:MAG: threonylcarbamoyl-AMP synthase [Streptosporangiaceae bacterium]|nr:threonylcarbamoyl-AMP synthase [Streptosporangiaceae bacterium]